MTLSAGTYLQNGKYIITRFISRGGFGCTYEARHVALDKRVAIKEFFVSDYCNRDASGHISIGTLSRKPMVDRLRAKFIEEARALSQMSHSGLVRVNDVFEENGTAYYVMDFLDGSSLEQLIRSNGALNERDALHYIGQVADVLGYVHSLNRLHLDIKPGNMMVDGSGRVTLIDFGSSKYYDEATGTNDSTLLSSTPGYATPEQHGGKLTNFSPATDIYALGATLYKMLTGLTPPDVMSLISGSESLRPLPASLSEATRLTVAASMNVMKDKRPQSTAEFMQMLLSPVPETDDTIPVDSFGGGHSDGKYASGSSSPKPDGRSTSQSPAAGKPKQSSGSRWILPVVLLASIAIGATIYVAFNSSGHAPAAPTPFVDSVEAATDTAFAVVPPAPAGPKEVVDLEFLNRNGKKFSYTGPVDADGMPHGKGRGVYDNGVYTGMYDKGVMAGSGRYETNDGTNIFEGQFADDKYSNGRLTLDDGTYYEGTFKNEKFHTGNWYDKSGKVTDRMEAGKIL